MGSYIGIVDIIQFIDIGIKLVVSISIASVITDFILQTIKNGLSWIKTIGGK